MVFPESPLRDLYRLLAWGPWPRVLYALPPGADLQACRLLGRTVALAASGSRARVEANLRRAFPGRTDLDIVARAAFATHFAHQYLPIAFPRITRENAAAYLFIDGLSHLDAALARGHGAVLMLPHMGPVQLPLCVLGVLGYPTHQVGGGEVKGLSPRGEWAASRRRAFERAMPVTVHDGKSYLRPVLRALQAGGVVLATCDGTGGGEELGRREVRPVCGHPMKIPVGPVWLALQSGAPLLSLVTVRDRAAPAPYRSAIQPVDLPRDLRPREALARGADLAAAFLTDTLTRHPGDWHFWDQYEPGRFLEEA